MIEQRRQGQDLPDPEDKASTIENAIRRHFQEVEPLGIVRGFVVGAKPDQGSYIWNIFSEDLSSERLGEQPFQDLNRLSYELEKRLAGLASVRVGHVSPSRVEALLRACKEQGIDTTMVDYE